MTPLVRMVDEFDQSGRELRTTSFPSADQCHVPFRITWSSSSFLFLSITLNSWYATNSLKNVFIPTSWATFRQSSTRTPMSRASGQKMYEHRYCGMRKDRFKLLDIWKTSTLPPRSKINFVHLQRGSGTSQASLLLNPFAPRRHLL